MAEKIFFQGNGNKKGSSQTNGSSTMGVHGEKANLGKSGCRQYVDLLNVRLGTSRKYCKYALFGH
jgi:hypothetical protein